MHIVLVHGLWLRVSVWDEVLALLIASDYMPITAVPLPADASPASPTTLEDQLDAVLAAIDSQPEPAVVVGHSAAATLAWMAADRRPDRVAQTVLIGGFPQSGGEQYAPFFPIVNGAMPFPGWEAFEGPDSEDLTGAQCQEIASAAIPVPEAVARSTVTYTSEARFDVPTALLCPEYSPEQARKWIAADDVPELSRTKHVSYADLNSGHWPMLTRPAQLAAAIADFAE